MNEWLIKELVGQFTIIVTGFRADSNLIHNLRLIQEAFMSGELSSAPEELVDAIDRAIISKEEIKAPRVTQG